MTNLYVSNGKLEIVTPERLTTNAINAYEMSVDFEDDWSGFAKTAVFYQTTKGKKINIEVADSVVMIPAEILQVNLPVYVGFVGKKNGVKKTTNYVKLEIADGADVTSTDVSFVQTVDTKINYIRLSATGVFEYSTDGSTWTELQGGSGASGDVAINGTNVPKVNDVPNIVTDTDTIAYEKVGATDEKKLTLSQAVKKELSDNASNIELLKTATKTNTDSIVSINEELDSIHDDITAVNAKAEKNAQDIGTINGNIASINQNIETINGNVTTIDGKVSAVDEKVTTLDGKVTTLSGKVDKNTEDISGLDTKVTKNTEDIAKANTEIGKKFDKTGGTISGNVAIQGDITVSGTTKTEHVEQIAVDKPVIIANGNKVDLQTLLAGLAINKNANATYGIMYDPADDTVKFGAGTVDDEDHFTFNQGEGLPLAVRADSATFTNAHLIKWNAEKNMFEDAGFAIADFKVKDITLNNASTASFASDDGITVRSQGTVKYQDNTTTEVTSEIDLPIFGDSEDISIDADAENENVHIKGVEYIVITLPASATNGTLTQAQYSQLVNKKGNVLVVNNECYRLEDKGHEEGFLTYTHVGITGTQQYIKTLTITIATYAFTIITTAVRDLQCVNITLAESATKGTLTEEEYNRLTAYDMNLLCINGNEYYRLNDKGHTVGINTYTHDGFNEKGVTKYFNLTLSTRAFTITTENNGTVVKYDGKTITQNADSELQAVGLTNGTNQLSYADILQAMTIERL